MAPSHAGSAGIGLRVTYRDIPGAETGNPLLYETLLLRRVRVVAGLAGTPLVRLVDMEKMKIGVAVAEPGQGIGAPVLGDVLFVAVEAKGEIPLGIGEVERLGESTLEQFRPCGTVGGVAVGALPFGDRLVN